MQAAGAVKVKNRVSGGEREPGTKETRETHTRDATDDCMFRCRAVILLSKDGTVRKPLRKAERRIHSRPTKRNTKEKARSATGGGESHPEKERSTTMTIPESVLNELDLNRNSAETPDYREVYDIVSITAFLAGVPRSIFENVHEPPQLSVYQTLTEKKPARILRDLCMLRTALEQHFATVNRELRYDLRNLDSIDGIPQDALRELKEDGVSVLRVNTRAVEYVVLVNRLIARYLPDCRDLYPLWLNWDYIRELFLMPGGTTEAGTQEAAKRYYASRSWMPYQIYLNWTLGPNGNIFHNDAKFLDLLYRANGDRFCDRNRVKDARALTKNDILNFLQNGKNAVIAVDCENVDLYRLAACLRTLEESGLNGRVRKIILFDDVNTSPAWKILARYTGIPVDYRLIERLKENKSLVDLHLTAEAFREYYENGMDSLIIVSSDSDYWSLISALPKVRYLVMTEEGNASPDYLRALGERDIPYCSLNEFCTAKNELEIAAVKREAESILNGSIAADLEELLRQAMLRARARLSAEERKQLLARSFRKLRVVVDQQDNIRLALG